MGVSTLGFQDFNFKNDFRNMDPWCSVSFLIHSLCFQTWKFTFKERFKANQNCRNARVYSKISVGFVCIFAWDLFVYLLSNVEVHF